MPSPFPGMDPYLEHPMTFPDVHDRLIVRIDEALQAGAARPLLRGDRAEQVWVEVSRRFVGPDASIVSPGGPRRAGGPRRPATRGRPRGRHRPPRRASARPGSRSDSGAKAGDGSSPAIEVLSPSNKTPGEHGGKTSTCASSASCSTAGLIWSRSTCFGPACTRPPSRSTSSRKPSDRSTITSRSTDRIGSRTTSSTRSAWPKPSPRSPSRSCPAMERWRSTSRPCSTGPTTPAPIAAASATPRPSPSPRSDPRIGSGPPASSARDRAAMRAPTTVSASLLSARGGRPHSPGVDPRPIFGRPSHRHVTHPRWIGPDRGPRPREITRDSWVLESREVDEDEPGAEPHRPLPAPVGSSVARPGPVH